MKITLFFFIVGSMIFLAVMAITTTDDIEAIADITIAVVQAAAATMVAIVAAAVLAMLVNGVPA